MQNIIKIIGQTIFLAIASAFNEIYPLAILAFLFVIADCITAFRLSRRMRRNGCTRNGKTSCGKFKSSKMRKTVFELIIVIPFGLMLAYWVQKYIFYGNDIHLPQIFAGIVIFWQLWSILENESSCNNEQWAKILQKIMVDKTERHFSVDLSELKKESENENS